MVLFTSEQGSRHPGDRRAHCRQAGCGWHRSGARPVQALGDLVGYDTFVIRSAAYSVSAVPKLATVVTGCD